METSRFLTSLSKRGCNWSGPGDLFTFKLFNFFSILSASKLMSVNCSVNGQSLNLDCTSGVSFVNTVLKYLFKTSAFLYCFQLQCPHWQDKMTGYNAERNAESKVWNRKFGMELIGRGVRPRDRCHSADYHTSLNRQSGVWLVTTNTTDRN